MACRDSAGSSKPAGDVATGAIAWMADDYAGGLARAQAERKPLVVDMWTPWCHSCMSMKQYVLTDPSFAALADRFVWVALDTDREVNAAAQEKLPTRWWPTYYVVSSVDESIQASYAGAMSVAEFRELLERGERGHRDRLGSAGQLDHALSFLRDADRHFAGDRYAEAAAAYAAAAEAGGPAWPRRREALMMQAYALTRAERWDECADLGLARLREVVGGSTAATADFAMYVFGCSRKLADKDKASQIQRLLAAKDGPYRTLLADAAARLSVDDRWEALWTLGNIEDALGNADESRRLVAEQRRLLDQAMKDAPNVFIEMSYNWPRTWVYLKQGEGEKLIPDLQRQMEALPKQFDPPHRLAYLYFKLGRHDDALATAKIAEARSYGPRVAEVYELRAQIHEARGERDKQVEALNRALQIYRELPAGHRRERDLKRVEAGLNKAPR